jgi:hypothetical protein
LQNNIYTENTKNMNAEERLNLKKMLAQNTDYVDHTEDIRRLKHSGLLLDGMRDIEKLKRANAELREKSPDEFIEMCKVAAPLMYNLYTDLFNKLVKDELNLVIMIKLIRILELIEQEKLDQNEGSVMVGKMLKDLYVDSANRLGDKLDKQREDENPTPEQKTKPKNINWNAWKQGVV